MARALIAALVAALLFLSLAGGGLARAQDPAAPAAVPVEGAELEPALEELPSPWTGGLITSMVALGVGGFAAILGIWVDRDKSRPIAFASVMSALIAVAIFVGGAQSYLDAEKAIQQRADLKRMLDMVAEIAVSSGDQKLADLLTSEGRPKLVLPKISLPTLSVLPPEAAALPAPATP